MSETEVVQKQDLSENKSQTVPAAPDQETDHSEPAAQEKLRHVGGLADGGESTEKKRTKKVVQDEKKSSPEKSEKDTENNKKRKRTSFSLKGISPADVEFSLRHLSLMLKSGLSITESLAVIVEQCSDDRMKNTYEEILSSVQQGKSISQAMSEYPKIFSDVVVSIVRISEQTGTLESNLVFLADYLKKSYELQRKVMGAMIYPLIVLGMTVAEMLGVAFFILPKMEVMFASFDNVPAFSLMVVNLARMVRENIFFIAIGGVVLFFIIKQLAKTKPGKRFTDRLSIGFPIIKRLSRNNLLASFSRTLGMLLESGIPISESLKVTAGTMTNCVYAEATAQIYKDVKEGKNLADSMLEHQDLFPISFIRIIEAGEKTGTLEENLSYMYGSFSTEVEIMANNMVTLLEPLLLMFAGAMIGLLAITIIAPIYQFTSSIN
ncbi:MAG: type II secretion system F family protein [Candidatus Dojkabacteria bacterium]|nr:type II secretion system F family protein [Candidatus Dojkabacteria bacterium]